MPLSRPMQLALTSLTTAGMAAGLAWRGTRVRRAIEAGAIRVDGRLRTYVLHVPKSYDGQTPLPLMLALHGTGGRGPITKSYTGFDALADAAGMFVVYPNAVDRMWSLTPDERRLRLEPGYLDDVGFITKLVARLGESYAIDRRQIYASGISLGGVFCYALAANLPFQLRAIAPVAAVMPVEFAEPLQGRAPIPVLAINGDADPVVHWNENPLLAKISRLPLCNVLDTLAFLRTWHGCETDPEVSYVPLGERWNGTRARHEVYRRSDGSAPLEFYVIEGGGHTWPGSTHSLPQRLVGATNFDLNASATIMEFFGRHST